MDTIGQILTGIGGLGGFICFILVIVQMFQRGSTGLAIACLLLTLCCGFGALIAFIYGWIKNSEWGIRNVMLVYTACVVLVFVGGVLAPDSITRFRGFLPF